MIKIGVEEVRRELARLGPDTLVIAHRDADGVTAAVQLSIAFGFHRVVFPKIRFEPPKDVDADAIVMVDMGAGLDLTGIPVDNIIVIDHHPPTGRGHAKLYWSEWCASASVALIHQDPSLFPFALAGMIGDMQQRSELYDALRDRAEAAEPLAKLRNAYGQTPFEAIARMVNALNRLWGGDGAALVHRFLAERGFRGFVEDYFIEPRSPDAKLLRMAERADAELRATAYSQGESALAKTLLGAGRLEFSRYRLRDMDALWIETNVGAYQSWLASREYGNNGGMRLVAAFQPRPLGEPIIAFSMRGPGARTAAHRLAERLGGVAGGHEEAAGGSLPPLEKAKVLETLVSLL